MSSGATGGGSATGGGAATGGGTATGGGAGSVASSSGTIAGMPAALRSGYARLDSNAGVLLVLSDLAPGWACPTQSAWVPHAGEASMNVMLTAPAGSSLVGTFPFSRSSPQPAGQALAFILRAPAICPAFVGDGTVVVGGTITITSTTTGSLLGSLHAMAESGEVLDAQFAVPFCSLAGIGGQCVP